MMKMKIMMAMVMMVIMITKLLMSTWMPSTMRGAVSLAALMMLPASLEPWLTSSGAPL